MTRQAQFEECVQESLVQAHKWLKRKITWRAFNWIKAVLSMLVRIHAVQGRREGSNADQIADGYRNDVEVNADITPPNAFAVHRQDSTSFNS